MTVPKDAGRRTIRSSTDEWRAIAQGPDVLYHICTWSDRRHSWTEDEFYQSGRDDWADFTKQWRSYDPDLGGHCVEIGCGAGRMTAALAPDFSAVTSVDVSADMIERARAHAPDHVTFHQVSGSELPVADGSADAVFSVHVMQHLDNQAAIERYLSEAHRALKPGGTIMIHIMIAPDQTTWRKRAKLRLDLLRSRRALARGEEHFAVQMVMPRPWAAVQMVERAGFTNVELRAFRVNSNNSFYTFFVGRR